MQRQEASRRRFLREAKAAAALDHPYICKIYQTGEEDGCPFIAMEYVRGDTLRRRLDSAPLPVNDVLRVAVEVAEAPETAHAAQIVHRDLKPSNIMLTTGGHAKVLDFGLAKRLAEARGVYTETTAARADASTLQGTVAYMSPEQVRGQELDTRSDIFSFGVVPYECQTGTNPFQAGSALETAWQILHRTPPPPSRARSDMPPALDAIVDRMLAKAPEDRFQSAHDLRMELVRVSALVDRGQARDEAPGQPAPSPWRLTRRRTLIGLATMAVALIGAGAWWATRTPHSTPGNGTPLSLAVLPFVNFDDDPQNAYLANGITQA